MALVAILSFVPAHVFSSPGVKGVAIGITQSFQFFGLHTFCPQNIWPQTPVLENFAHVTGYCGEKRRCTCTQSKRMCGQWRHEH